MGITSGAPNAMPCVRRGASLGAQRATPSSGSTAAPPRLAGTIIAPSPAAVRRADAQAQLKRTGNVRGLFTPAAQASTIDAATSTSASTNPGERLEMWLTPIVRLARTLAIQRGPSTTNAVSRCAGSLAPRA